MPIGEIFLPYAKQLLADRYDPNQLLQGGGLMKMMKRMGGLKGMMP